MRKRPIRTRAMNETSLAVPAGETTSAPLRFGDPLYRACDHCGRAIGIVPLLSGNALGGTLWSDGYLQASQLPEQALLGRCRGCGEIVCLVDLRPLPPPDEPGKGEDYTFLPLTLDDFAGLLANLDGVSENFHAYLRIKFWQLSNDRRRRGETEAPLSEQERENLLSLLELLGTEEPDRLMKAEICRQLEDFDRAEELLAAPFDERISPVVERMQRLVQQRNHRLVKILSGEAPRSSSAAKLGSTIVQIVSY